MPRSMVTQPHLTDAALVTADGLALPLRRWLPAGAPKAVVLGLHGLNDYAYAFDRPGRIWAEHGIATYAYDQRGFGGAPGRGRWHGHEAMTADLAAMVRLLRERHPGRPVYLLGESLGAAVVMAAMGQPGAPAADGVILSAPAVWRPETMPPLQRAAIRIALALAPGLTVGRDPQDSGATDNREILAEMAADPMMIRASRIDTLAGAGALMDLAAAAAPALDGRVLLLYGASDSLIPAAATESVVRALTRAGRADAAVIRYRDGYHLLLRDRQAPKVIDDIRSWMLDPERPLLADAERQVWLAGPGGTAPAATQTAALRR